MQLTLEEYAKSINAKLMPTCLADMPIVKKQPSNGKYFIGSNVVVEWLNVKDPSGGLNGYLGYWPFSVEKLEDDSLVIRASGY